MKLLEERIKKDGQVPKGGVLRTNPFLNYQVDPKLMMEIGQEFARLFKDNDITKVLTYEASGIAPNIMATHTLSALVVFTRKKKPPTLNDAIYLADVFSYTRKVSDKIYAEKKFLSLTDKVLILDDFVVYSEAAKGMVSVVQQTGARTVGIGVIAAKDFQGGSDWIRKQGSYFGALANVVSFEDREIHFVGEGQS